MLFILTNTTNVFTISIQTIYTNQKKYLKSEAVMLKYIGQDV